MPPSRIARDTPPSPRYGSIQNTLNRELQAIWLAGKDVDAALADADAQVQDLLDRQAATATGRPGRPPVARIFRWTPP